MRWYMRHRLVFLRNDRFFVLFAMTYCICHFIFGASIRAGSDPNRQIFSSIASADGNHGVEDVNGPTLLLGYSQEDIKINPISSFMYFIPLISPTLVGRETSANNEQKIGIFSYKRKITSKSFNVICELKLSGKGFHRNTFDPNGMMALFIEELKKGETLTNMLDYIQFEGDGFGRIEVKGTNAGSAKTVTEVNIQFNAKGRKSPVTIGLYDVAPENGHYLYQNRTNQSIARVNSLIFKKSVKKSEKDPRMGIKVASISKSPDSDGFWASIKGAIANLLIRPPKVDKLGNETMLNLGNALLEQKPEFIFPKAENIKENKIIEIDSISK